MVCVCKHIDDRHSRKMNRVLTVDLTRIFIYKDKHNWMVHNTFINMCVTDPLGKSKLIPHLFSRIWSHPSFRAATRNLVMSRSRISTRELKTVGGQKGGGNSAWNRKRFSSLWPLDHPNTVHSKSSYDRGKLLNMRAMVWLVSWKSFHLPFAS